MVRGVRRRRREGRCRRRQENDGHTRCIHGMDIKRTICWCGEGRRGTRHTQTRAFTPRGSPTPLLSSLSPLPAHDTRSRFAPCSLRLWKKLQNDELNGNVDRRSCDTGYQIISRFVCHRMLDELKASREIYVFFGYKWKLRLSLVTIIHFIC